MSIKHTIDKKVSELETKPRTGRAVNSALTVDTHPEGADVFDIPSAFGRTFAVNGGGIEGGGR